MLVVCFHILAVKIYCLVVGFCDSQYFKALTLPAGHTVNFHENSNIAEIGHCVISRFSIPKNQNVLSVSDQYSGDLIPVWFLALELSSGQK